MQPISLGHKLALRMRQNPRTSIRIDFKPHAVLLTKKNKPGKQATQKAFHTQNVNALHSRYNDFMGPFKGPASKCLGRYLRWFLLRSKMDGGAVFRRVLSPQ